MRVQILVVSIFASVLLTVSVPVRATGGPPVISAVVSETRSLQPSSDSPRVETPASGHASATASFVPPEHCVEDPALARTLRVVRVCIQRFSATHEFAVVLSEYRLRTSREDVVSNAEIAAMAVSAHIEKLYEANQGRPGILLGLFEVLEQLRPEENGADHCSTVLSVAVDRRVPGYEGEEFRIWAETYVCARADSSDNSIQVVELRCSERFRVETDQFKERFEYLEPFRSAMEAEQSLKMY